MFTSADPKGVLPGEHYLDGDWACCEGALAAGCRFIAGYPITPSTEVVERFARRIPTIGGVKYGALATDDPSHVGVDEIHLVERIDCTRVQSRPRSPTVSSAEYGASIAHDPACVFVCEIYVSQPFLRTDCLWLPFFPTVACV